MPLLKPIRGAQLEVNHPLRRGLYRCWLLNEGGGNMLFDLAGRTEGQLQRGYDWKAGPEGYGIEFDGTSGYANLDGEDATYLGPHAWTIRVMFYALPSSSTTCYLLDYIYSGGHSWSLMGAGWHDKIVAIYWRSDGTQLTIPGPTIELGRWYNVTGVYDGDTLSVYVDAIFQGSGQVGAIYQGSDYQLRLGHPAQYSPEAKIAHAMIWSRPLIAAEVRWLARDPYAVCQRPFSPTALSGPCYVSISGMVAAGGALSGTVRYRPRSPWAGGSLSITKRWLKEALYNGCTSNAFKLGTALTQGWFWTRTAGCDAIYRGQDANVDYESVQAVVAGDEGSAAISQQNLPPGTIWKYTRRSMSDCGLESADGPSCLVRIGSDGAMRPLEPNAVQQLSIEPVAGGKVRLRWAYVAIDHDAAPSEFRIYIDSGSGFDYDNPDGTVRAVLSGAGEYEWTSAALTGGQPYKFCVRPYSSAGGETQTADEVSEVIDATGPPAISRVSGAWEEVD